MLIIVIISTIIIISTILIFIIIEKEHKKFLIFFDFDLEDLIIFINHISRRGKFKRFKHSFFISQNKLKRFHNFTFIIFLNIS